MRLCDAHAMVTNATSLVPVCFIPLSSRDSDRRLHNSSVGNSRNRSQPRFSDNSGVIIARNFTMSWSTNGFTTPQLHTPSSKRSNDLLWKSEHMYAGFARPYLG